MDEDRIIDMICYEIEDHNEAIALVKKLDSPEGLYKLLDNYNWDDGVGIPHAIAEHPCCELAIAQKIFWLAAADYWYYFDKEVKEYYKEEFEFSKLISQRLLSGYYEVGSLSHTEKFGRVQVYKFKKQGFPEVFFQPVVGNNEQVQQRF